jgi:hypothetical protein
MPVYPLVLYVVPPFSFRSLYNCELLTENILYKIHLHSIYNPLGPHISFYSVDKALLILTEIKIMRYF